jgi:cell wall-associated NlpC family hydrolase
LHFRHNAGKLALAFAATLAVIASMVVPAGAGQLANERAEAQALADKIAALGQQEAALGEQYDAGVANLALADARVRAAARALALAQAGQAKTMTLLQQDAVDAYVGSGPQLTLDASLPNLNDALLRQEIEQTFAADEADAQDGYRLAAADASTARSQLVAARNADAAQVAQLLKDRNQVQAAQDQLVALEAQVKGKIAALVAEIQREEYLAEQRAEEARLAQEQAAEAAQARQLAAAAAAAAAEARAEAAAQAQAQARQKAALEAQLATEKAAAAAGQSAGSDAAATTTVPAATTTVPATIANPSGGGTTIAVPGVSSAAAVAVAAAEGRVGDPYVWGAAGPGAFDCSGLVMWAYAQAGVSLPHYSGSQYDETIHIPMSDLEPGDLVFPADPGVHVAMYIGNGEIVQAPYTGANVQIVPLTGYFVLASRIG